MYHIHTLAACASPICSYNQEIWYSLGTRCAESLAANGHGLQTATRCRATRISYHDIDFFGSCASKKAIESLMAVAPITTFQKLSYSH